MQQHLSNLVRPKTIDEIVGMEENKKILYYDIEGSKKLNQPLPSYILSGPAGAGKTTLANIIASLSNGNVFKYVGTEVKTAEDLVNISMACADNDIIYLEEAHSVGKAAQTAMLEWLENFKMPDGFDAPKVSFVMPTTSPGKLSKSLRDRCKNLHVSFYKTDELKEILRRAGSKIELDLSSDDEALSLLAKCSRGTPRIAINGRLDSLKKIMVVDKRPYCLDTVKFLLQTQNINEWGLEPNDVQYLEVLYSKVLQFKKPVSKANMSYSTGFDLDMIEEVIERYLLQIDAIKIETRGRMITNFGCKILEKVNPLVNSRLMITE